MKKLKLVLPIFVFLLAIIVILFTYNYESEDTSAKIDYQTVDLDNEVSIEEVNYLLYDSNENYDSVQEVIQVGEQFNSLLVKDQQTNELIIKYADTLLPNNGYVVQDYKTDEDKCNVSSDMYYITDSCFDKLESPLYKIVGNLLIYQLNEEQYVVYSSTNEPHVVNKDDYYLDEITYYDLYNKQIILNSSNDIYEVAFANNEYYLVDSEDNLVFEITQTINDYIENENYVVDDSSIIGEFEYKSITTFFDYKENKIIFDSSLDRLIMIYDIETGEYIVKSKPEIDSGNFFLNYTYDPLKELL